MSRLDKFLEFSKTDDALKKRLEALIEWFPVKKGSLLIEEAAQADFAVFVLEGTFEIFRESKKGETKFISYSGEGTILGELGLLTDSSRSASCRAEKDSFIGMLTKENLENIQAKDVELYACLMKVLASTVAHRLKDLVAKVNELVDKNNVAVYAANMILEKFHN